jgi:predicted phosphohydrolase
MDSTQIKTHLHQLIDETNDLQLLTDLVEQIEETKSGTDWWDTLSKGQQQRVLQSEEQYKNGQVVSNETVLEKIRQWLQK